MAWHYSTKDFFRQITNALLARYFHARGNSAIPCSFAANQTKEVTVSRSDSPIHFRYASIASWSVAKARGRDRIAGLGSQ